ncbi:class 1b ribonucleoside-diphosphate reductase subunit beta [Oenococcus sicerae]|uniref:Ribonucleoside-diphosphate reductase subunit beta n=1 Tax=Oenococcus sicerae TaxID=2203724 RepID=A0ABX5QLU9_9LACO|nr:class 1b ribonucleoside-diphosphate reductase subunit beta [Oenococcus sicerae]QAS69717.1 class 1b ribonucleoside-diphosphate reductase subunit beta [Oenococcus sicerae]
MADEKNQFTHYDAINWNKVIDPIDKATWEKLTEQFWLDTRIPISNDLKDWRGLGQTEHRLYDHVFGGLTMLDTLQSQDGMFSLLKSAVTPHERAVLNNIEFMESVHAKSYSSIFETLDTPAEIDEIFDWASKNEQLQYKANKINALYHDPNPLKRKVASVFLETFLFYSGFYTPLYFVGHNKMANVAEIIKLIIRDESVHGTYIGYKFQVAFQQLSEKEQQELTTWAYDLLYDLYDNEENYTHQLYDDIGWFDDVMVFLRYNGNKALMNLGLEPMFADGAEDVNPVVMNGISTSTANHDFFSQVGNGYRLGEVEDLSADDYQVGGSKQAGLDSDKES